MSDTPNHAWLTAEIVEHQRLTEAVAETLLPMLESICQHIAPVLAQGGRVFFCGNGGSAADAQHLAAELTGRFRTQRKSLAGIALTTDTSALTAIANDYGYEHVFERQLEGLGKTGDVLLGISTSGNSPSVVKAFEYAQKNGISTVGFLGKTGGALRHISDFALVVPHDDTARIQEMHILLGHLLCAYLDRFFSIMK
jgi:D-sedoheptulose 7-phosphate isomerase